MWMGTSHMKYGRSRMRENCLSYKMFKGVNCGGFLFYFMRLVSRLLSVSILIFLMASFLPAYLYQSADL